MPRGTTLTELIRQLRTEAGQASTQTQIGGDYEATLIQKLRRTQQMLYDDYDWPFLRIKCPINLGSGQRYYDLPFDPNDESSQMDMERIEHVTINYSGKPTLLEKGISWEQYAQYNSDNGEQASPCRRWDIKRTSAQNEQIEAWPIPTDDTQLMEFTGIKKLRSLVFSTDVADLDDIVIVLTAASEILAKAGSKDAAKIEAAAAARLKQLKARTKGASRPVNLASNVNTSLSNRGKTIIRIGSQTN